MVRVDRAVQIKLFGLFNDFQRSASTTKFTIRLAATTLQQQRDVPISTIMINS